MRDKPGMSAFVLEDGVVYHSYSTYGRGLDGLWGMYQWLDRAPKGRNEAGIWWRRHDEYGKGEPCRRRARARRRTAAAAHRAERRRSFAWGHGESGASSPGFSWPDLIAGERR